jgi:hypothetical protein
VDTEIEAFQREMLAIAARAQVQPPMLGDQRPLFGLGDFPADPARRLAPPDDPAPTKRNPTLGLVEDQLTPLPAKLPAPVPAMPKLESILKDDVILYFGMSYWVVNFKEHDSYFLVRKNNWIPEIVSDPPASLDPNTVMMGRFFQGPQGPSFQADGKSEVISLFPETGFRSIGTFGVGAEVFPTPTVMLDIEKKLLTSNLPLTPAFQNLLTLMARREAANIRGGKDYDEGVRLHHCMIGDARLYLIKVPLTEALRQVSKEEILNLTSQIAPFLGAPTISEKNQAFDFIKELTPFLSHKNQVQMVPLLVDAFLAPRAKDLDYRQNWGRSDLLETFTLLGTEARLEALKRFVERTTSEGEISQDHLHLLERLLLTLPTEVLEKKLESNPPRSLQMLIQAYLKGLPFVKPIYDQYLLQAKDSQKFLDWATERVDYTERRASLLEGFLSSRLRLRGPR